MIIVYEPKPVIEKTIDGRIIEVYDYLADLTYIQLSNDVVIAINVERDEIDFLTLDSKGFYFSIAQSSVEKPTLGAVKVNFHKNNLQTISTFDKNQKTKTTPVSQLDDQISNLILQFFNRDN